MINNIWGTVRQLSNIKALHLGGSAKSNAFNVRALSRAIEKELNSIPLYICSGPLNLYETTQNQLLGGNQATRSPFLFNHDWIQSFINSGFANWCVDVMTGHFGVSEHAMIDGIPVDLYIISRK